MPLGLCLVSRLEGRLPNAGELLRAVGNFSRPRCFVDAVRPQSRRNASALDVEEDTWGLVMAPVFPAVTSPVPTLRMAFLDEVSGDFAEGHCVHCPSLCLIPTLGTELTAC